MTAIQWTQQTWNPIVGCSVVSPGCTNCYAMRMAWRLANNPATPHYHGTVKMVNGNPVWTGKVALAPEATLTAPLRRRIPTDYFVDSMGDLFHENTPDEQIDKAFAVMALCPQHRFQVLTKRSARMRDYLGTDHVNIRWIRQAQVFGDEIGNPPDLVVQITDTLRNVHLGVSAEDQRRADERIPDLLATPAAVRFVSYEPALAAVDFFPWLGPYGPPGSLQQPPQLDWIIVGGESGPGARPCNVEWIRAAVRQCQAAHVPVFVKQLGSCFVDEINGTAGATLKIDPDVVIARRLRDRKGGDMDEWPADLRIREMPR